MLGFIFSTSIVGKPRLEKDYQDKHSSKITGCNRVIYTFRTSYPKKGEFCAEETTQYRVSFGSIQIMHWKPCEMWGKNNDPSFRAFMFPHLLRQSWNPRSGHGKFGRNKWKQNFSIVSITAWELCASQKSSSSSKWLMTLNNFSHHNTNR